MYHDCPPSIQASGGGGGGGGGSGASSSTTDTNIPVSTSQQLSCAICMQPMFRNESIIAFGCLHIFHEVCGNEHMRTIQVGRLSGCPLKCAQSVRLAIDDADSGDEMPLSLQHIVGNGIPGQARWDRHTRAPAASVAAVPDPDLIMRGVRPVAKGKGRSRGRGRGRAPQSVGTTSGAETQAAAALDSVRLTPDQLETIRSRRLEAMARRRARVSIDTSDMRPAAAAYQQEPDTLAATIDVPAPAATHVTEIASDDEDDDTVGGTQVHNIKP